jgi:glycosyltransferase involved in cell wall biosynthesis
MTLDLVSNESTSKHIIVCIPAYNEEDNIREIITKAKTHASEVIVYDDGSIDRTSEIAKEVGAVVIRNSRNKGYGKALSELFKFALKRNADIMITLDSDGQHDPDQIPEIIDPLMKNEADIVIGSRFLKKEDMQHVPSYRNFGIRAITKFTQVVSYNKITDAQSGFRAYNLNALDNLKLYEDGMAISTEILLKANEHNLRVAEVPITVTYNGNGSTHNPIAHGLAVFNHLFRYLSFRKPLIFYGIPGLLLLFISSIFMYSALDLFSTTRFVSTNMIILSLGFAIMGILLMATSAIVYTLITLFKGRLREI